MISLGIYFSIVVVGCLFAKMLEFAHNKKGTYSLLAEFCGYLMAVVCVLYIVHAIYVLNDLHTMADNIMKLLNNIQSLQKF